MSVRFTALKGGGSVQAPKLEICPGSEAQRGIVGQGAGKQSVSV